MMDQGRSVCLVLCAGERVLGALPPFRVEVPWWPEVADVVATARRLFDLEVTVLRLIGWPADSRAGGQVSYLAEVAGVATVPLSPWAGDPLADHPLRQAWARPGGPSELLAWAEDRLSRQGVAVTEPAGQIKSWNLSALWRLSTTKGVVWLKCVPDFFGHEGAVIDAVGPPLAPRLLAFESGRILMAEIDGEDHHDATGDVLLPMIDLLTAEQARWVGRTDELSTLGLPDRRLGTIPPRIRQVAETYADQLTAPERRHLTALVDELPQRMAALDDCGIPDTLVHGDFHPGNVRGTPGHYVILDWGDSAVGHPLTDELAFTRRLGPADRAAASRRFAQAWRALVPGCDTDRAVELLAPVTALIAATQYADFVAAIEPDEHVYHAADVPEMLRQACAASHQSSTRVP